MSFATTVNIVTIILCLAVLVQSTRMMRSLAAFKAADLPAIVKTLEAATAQARLVLSELKTVLKTDAGPSMAALGKAQDMRDELGVMIEIANGTADRLVDAAKRAGTAANDIEEMAA